MRIIAGTHRGRRIDAPKGMGTRPTGDRVREAVFSILGSVEGARVLDLFAGSGAMGLEALSRGAARVDLVERDPRACRVIASNVERLGLHEQTAVLRRDVAGALRELARARRRYDLVFLDAPYEEWEAVEALLGELLPDVVEDGGLVVVETAAVVEPTLPFDLVTTRRYGSARITVFQR